MDTEGIRVADSQSQLLLDALLAAFRWESQDRPYRELFEELLDAFRQISGSEFGFIGETRQRDSGKPFMRTWAITNIAWDEATRAFYEKYAPDGLEFESYDSLWGSALLGREPVISNDPSQDPRSAGTPKGHPVLNSFLGLPFLFGGEPIGMVGLANRPGGYDEQVIQTLRPLTAACTSILIRIQTERARETAELGCRSSEDRFREFADAIPAFIWMLDAQQPLATFNRAWREFTGVPIEQCEADEWLELIHPADRGYVKWSFDEALRQQSAIKFTYRLRKHDGDFHWIAGHGRPRLRSDGRLVGIVGAGFELPEQAVAPPIPVATFSAASPAIDPTLFLDASGRVTGVNTSFENEFGTKSHQLLGQPLGRWLEAFSVARSAIETLTQASYSQRTVVCQARCQLASGNAQTRTIRLEPVHVSKSSTSGMIVVFGESESGSQASAPASRLWQDHQLLVAREQELCAELERMQKALTEARVADQAKSSFLANMSHEIRTPMTAILGYSEILLETKDQQEQHEAALIIRRSGEHLLALINDVLDLSKVEVGQFSIDRKRCSPYRLIQDVGELLTSITRAKGIDLNVEFLGDIPREIEADPMRLKQVLINVVSNAIKFTDKGSVTITTRYVEEAGRAELQIHVVDTGIGISDQQLGRIFEPFSQADWGTGRNFGGTGLGLTISRRLVRLMGGDIVVTSQVGRGSHFRLTIDPGPIAGETLVPVSQLAREADESESEKPVARQTATSDFRGSRILLVEDGPDNRRLLERLLTKSGFRVSQACNGREALALLGIDPQQETPSPPSSFNSPFQLILMDMQMPLLDGYEATREIRRRGITIPVIALTANAMASDRSACLEAGCDDYLSKPIQRATLLEAVQAWLSRAIGV